MSEGNREQSRAEDSEPVAVVLERLGVSAERGLSVKEARRRLREAGANRLRETRSRSLWRIALDQFASPVVVLLLIAAAVAAVFGQLVESAAIGVALLVNTIIGFGTEWQARESMEALHRLGRTLATVRRDGRTVRIPAEELVPGDIVLIEEGEVVPADLRLVTVENLQCDESALTGESVPVAKSVMPAPAHPLLSVPPYMAFKGTAVTRGAAESVVVATGMDTRIGHIAAMVESAKESLTPLERRLERLGKRLIYLVVAVGAAVTLMGVAAGKDLFLMIETGIVLAIAAVPEGLPIVATVALARGMWRMARRNALVKRLSAVETLGATTVICTDKTGTLTENRMVLRHLALPGGDVRVERTGESMVFRRDERRVDPQVDAELYGALRVGVLCTNAGYREGEPYGDPTEVALLAGAEDAGLGQSALLEVLPQQREESFDTETKKMATYHRDREGILVVVKGAPAAVLEVCTRVADPARGAVVLDNAGKRAWLARNEALASEGLRVLALAEKAVPTTDAAPYEELTLLGLVGLYDPPRDAVKEAIQRCRGAGIRVVMVTGDHPATAANIAHAVGIVDRPDPPVLTGADLDAMDHGRVDARRVHETAVFSRVSPAQKLRLVEIYQDYGEVVGMTGDGVNDAPALKKADIGVAMGRRGTEVARDASDIVLKDDAFETIVAAVEQGRTIFTNIRKFVIFLLSGNLGQIVAVGAAAMANAPLPLLPLQILFLNLLLDVFPALALGVGPGSAEVLDRPPRDPKEPVLTAAHWSGIGGFGLLMAASLLGVFGYALFLQQTGVRAAVTMAFLSYGFARLWHAFNMRSLRTGPIRNDVTRNPYVWGAIVLCGGLLVAAIYIPELVRLLQLQMLGVRQWLVVLAGGFAPLLIGQAALAVIARIRTSRQSPDRA